MFCNISCKICSKSISSRFTHLKFNSRFILRFIIFLILSSQYFYSFGMHDKLDESFYDAHEEEIFQNDTQETDIAIKHENSAIDAELKKYLPEARLSAAIDLLIIDNGPETSEREDVKNWLKNNLSDPKNLLSLRKYINEKFLGATPLQRYFQKTNPAILLELDFWKQLILFGADADISITYTFNKTTYQGHLSHYCVIANNLEALKFLLQKSNINPCSQDEQGRTALHLAIVCDDRQEIINYLIMNCSTATMLQDKKTISFLDIRDDFRKTALHMVVEKTAAEYKQDSIATINLLKLYQARLNIKDHKRKTALEIAKKNKNREIIKILNSVLYDTMTRKKSKSCEII